MIDCMEHVDERWSASKASEHFQRSMKPGSAKPDKPFNLLSNEVSGYAIGNKIGPSFIPVRHDWATRFHDDKRRLPGSLRWFGVSNQIQMFSYADNQDQRPGVIYRKLFNLDLNTITLTGIALSSGFFR
jgi:hypothetical protein